MQREVFIIVPARGGSKRVPNKNIKRLCGKTLIARTAEAVSASGVRALSIISTDEQKIAEEAYRNGICVPFLRPQKLATDFAEMTDVITHALDWHRDKYHKDPKILILLQPTSPFRGSECIKKALTHIKSNKNVDSIIGVRQLNIPSKHLYSKPNTIIESIGQSSDTPIYVPNGAIYLCRVDAFRREKTLYTKKKSLLKFNALRSLDIDTKEEWALAESILKNNFMFEKNDISFV